MSWNPLNWFKKNKKTEDTIEVESCISFCTVENGEIYIDINIKNYNRDTLDRFAILMADLFSLSLSNDTLGILKDGLANINKIEEYKYIIQKATDRAKENIAIQLSEFGKSPEQTEQSENCDDPIVKPSDIMK